MTQVTFLFFCTYRKEGNRERKKRYNKESKNNPVAPVS